MDNVVITKEMINRLLKDVKQIMKNPLTENGIFYIHDDEDMRKGYAMIVGPSDTPYFGGFYFFELTYPSDYPHSPPKVLYCTNGDHIRFNPNLYVCGKVCISLLNTWRGDQWTSCQTISTVLLTLCSLLCADPLLNEPGVTTENKDFETYTKIIEYKNVEIAMLKMIQKQPSIFPQNFNAFYSVMVEQFLKHKDVVMDMLEKKKVDNAEAFKLSTSMYSMVNVKIDWPKLYENYVETANTL
jgi:ubiquitin-protein ligase